MPPAPIHNSFYDKGLETIFGLPGDDIPGALGERSCWNWSVEQAQTAFEIRE